MSKEVAEVKKNELTVAEPNFDDHAGAGFGETSTSDYIIPRITIVGDLSAQHKKNNADYINGCEIGDVIDVAMKEVLAKTGEKFPFLPVARVKEIIEWRPRTQGGGIVSRQPLGHEKMETVMARLGVVKDKEFNYKNAEGNEFLETWQIYGLNLLKEGRWSFIPMKNSGLTAARPWFTKADMMKTATGNKAPLWYHVYNFSSAPDKRDTFDWHGWRIEDAGKLEEYSENWKDLYFSAVEFSKSIVSGMTVSDMTGDEPVDKNSIPF